MTHTRWQPYLAKAKEAEPFLALLLPYFTEAYETLAPLVHNDALIETTIWQDLKQRFLPVIARVCVMEMHSVSARGFLKAATPEGRFQEYIGALQDPKNAQDLLNKYPLMRDYLATIFKQYLHTSQLFWQRLSTDLPLLQETFLKDSNARLTAVHTSGDTHRQGLSVSILTFDAQKIVYKPRSLKIDEAFNHFLQWINTHSDFDFLPLPVLSRDEYGWCGFIPQTPCDHVVALQRFYRREGALLGILHVLAGSDIHLENLIAHGDQPVIVDLECLLKPIFVIDPNTQKSVPKPLVLDTCILPSRSMIDRHYSGFDISAFTGSGGEKSMYLGIDWEAAGTDQMRVKREHKILPKSHNIPTLQGEPIQPLTYANDFITGFQDLYQLILRERDFLLSSASPLYGFRQAEIRLVLRNTADYAKLLFESYHPELWYFADKRKAHFDWLRKAIDHAPFYQLIVDDEQTDLKSGNIPAFYTTTDGDQVTDGNGKSMPLTITQTGLARVLEHLRNHFGEDDLALQLRLIHYSFAALRLNQEPLQKNQSHLALPTAAIDIPTWKKRAAIIAKRLLKTVAAQAIDYDGKITWPTLEMAQHHTWNASLCGIDLYNGLSGIALTFAYAGDILGEGQDIIERLFEGLFTYIESTAPFNNIGAFSGAAGVLYALQKAPNSKRKQAAIEKLLSQIEKLLPEDKLLDVIGGSAGALLVLNTLPQSPRVSHLQALLAQHLLKQYADPTQFGLAGNSMNAIQPLLGFSHGVTGMVLALTGLKKRTAEIDLWIEKALAYEQHYFDAQQGWPDFRHSPLGYPAMWCHGAPGILLAKTYLPHCQTDCEAAIKFTLAKGFGGYHQLCHGDWGNLDCLFTHALTTHNEALLATAWQHAEALLTALEKGPVAFDQAQDIVPPGLMTGACGVIYQLLRMIAPDQVPCVLRLQ